MNSIRNVLRGVVGMAAACLIAGVALAQGGWTPGQQVVVTLDTGEVLTASFVSQGAEGLVLDHPVLGRITVSNARVAGVVGAAVPEQAPEVAEAARTAGAEAAAKAAEEAAKPPEDPYAFKWSGNIDLAVSGSEGNTERANILFGAGAKRESKFEVLDFTALYRLAFDRGDKTENRLFGRVQQEWLLQDSPWTVFLQGTVDYDEFQAYETRLRATGGVGYRFIDTDETKLIGRIGAGVRYDFDGPSEGEVIPEGFLGFDFNQKITDGIDFAAFGEYRPSFKDFGDYTLRGGASFDFALNNDKTLTARLGVIDEYNSMSGDFENNDFYYFAGVSYKF